MNAPFDRKEREGREGRKDSEGVDDPLNALLHQRGRKVQQEAEVKAREPQVREGLRHMSRAQGADGFDFDQQHGLDDQIGSLADPQWLAVVLSVDRNLARERQPSLCAFDLERCGIC